MNYILLYVPPVVKIFYPKISNNWPASVHNLIMSESKLLYSTIFAACLVRLPHRFPKHYYNSQGEVLYNWMQGRLATTSSVNTFHGSDSRSDLLGWFFRCGNSIWVFRQLLHRRSDFVVRKTSATRVPFIVTDWEAVGAFGQILSAYIRFYSY